MLIHDKQVVHVPAGSTEPHANVVLCSAKEGYRDERGLVALVDEYDRQLCIVAETSYATVETPHLPRDIDAPAMGFLAIEGTCLRMFCVHGMWFLSTHHRLDAYTSRWGTHVSFGELFAQGVSELCQVPLHTPKPAAGELAAMLGLDPVYAYMFVVRPRVLTATVACRPYPACPGDAPVFYAGRVPLHVRRPFPDMTGCAEHIPHVPYNIDCSNNRLHAKDVPWYATGVYLYTAHNQQVGELRKFWVPRCHLAAQARGNEPCVYTRYIQLFWHMEGNPDLRKAFINHYAKNARLNMRFANINSVLGVLVDDNTDHVVNTDARVLARLCAH